MRAVSGALIRQPRRRQRHRRLRAGRARDRRRHDPARDQRRRVDLGGADGERPEHGQHQRADLQLRLDGRTTSASNRRDDAACDRAWRGVVDHVDDALAFALGDQVERVLECFRGSGVAVPVERHVGQAAIGRDGRRLTGRALHLAQREYPWLVPTAEPHQREGPFAEVLFCLERQSPAVATEAAATVFATITGLLITFIGEPLTVQLLQKAWPNGFSEPSTGGT